MNFNFPPIKKLETNNYLPLKMCSRNTGSFMTPGHFWLTGCDSTASRYVFFS